MIFKNAIIALLGKDSDGSVQGMVRKLSAVIPNALTEASNLLSFEGEGSPAKLFAAFSHLLETAEEIDIPSSDALRRGEFRRLGLGDAAILETGKADCHILSADVGLYLAAVKAGYKASNFTHAIEAARV